MTTKNNSWRDFMTRAFHWVEKVDLKLTGELVNNAVHIVPASGYGTPQLDDKDLPAEVSTNLVKSLQVSGWRGRSPTLLSEGQRYFLVVPVTQFATSAKQKARQLGLDAAKGLIDYKFEQLVICSGTFSHLDVFDGLAMGFYAMNFNLTPAGKERKKRVLPDKVSLISSEISEQDLERSRRLARSIMITRTFQDAPPNWLNSEKFAELAQGIAEDLGIKCRVLGRAEMREQGMGSFLCVAQGSKVDPKLIIMEVDGKDNSRTVALAGKGITFDSGGISIKPGSGMADMKYDMSGAGAVVGAMTFLAQEQPPVRVVGLAGAVENMPSGEAVRPSDIVTAMDGTSIEVLNTDAEGRLVLADMLCYAVKYYDPTLIIDVATLTGAVIYALGHFGAGLISNNDQAAQRVLDCSASVGEPLWRLPMWPELGKEMEGTHADLQNIPSPKVKAGTTTAACFLERFVAEKPWVHLDIAGTAWDCTATGYPKRGGCAYALRTMVETCLSFK